MPRRKNEDKFYAVVSNRGSYLHGAFPLTEKGLTLAKKYVKNINLSEPDSTHKPKIIISS